MEAVSLLWRLVTSFLLDRRPGVSSSPVCLGFFMNKVGLRLFVYPCQYHCSISAHSHI